MSDGVSTVWVMRQGIGGGLEVDGHKNETDAVIALARHRSYDPDWIARMVDMRAGLQREIRNARAQRRRDLRTTRGAK